jgi:hypothetical protein
MYHNRKKLFSKNIKPPPNTPLREEEDDNLEATANLEELISRTSLNPRRNLDNSLISTQINKSLLHTPEPRQGVHKSLLDRGKILHIEREQRKPIHQIIHEESSSISGELYNLDLSKDTSQETEVSILSDCGTQFLSEIFKGICRLLGIKRIHTTS